MIQKIMTIFILSILFLIAQEDFLKGVKAEGLMLDRIEAVPVEIVKEIEDKGYHYWDSYILSYAYSPDSSLIAEERTEKPGGRIIGLWILDTNTNTERRIVEGLVEDFKWSPSGKYLSFIRLEYVDDPLYDKLPRTPFFNRERLCVYDMQTGETHSVVFIKGRNIEHFWSPTHDYLAYSYVDNEKRKYMLAVFVPENNKSRVLDELILCDLWNFCWSPDGEMIIYTKPLKMDMNIDEEVPLDSEIFVVNRDGSGKVQITDSPESEIFVKWLPDGKQIITELIRRPGQGMAPEYLNLILKKREQK